AGRDALINRFRGVRARHLDLFKRDIELFCDDLRQRGLDARTKVNHAAQDVSGAVRCDCEPGVKRRWVRFASGTDCLLREEVGYRGKKIEADNQRSRALEKLPAIEFDGFHGSSSFP